MISNGCEVFFYTTRKDLYFGKNLWFVNLRMQSNANQYFFFYKYFYIKNKLFQVSIYLSQNLECQLSDNFYLNWQICRFWVVCFAKILIFCRPVPISNELCLISAYVIKTTSFISSNWYRLSSKTFSFFFFFLVSTGTGYEYKYEKGRDWTSDVENLIKTVALNEDSFKPLGENPSLTFFFFFLFFLIIIIFLFFLRPLN